jgi:acylpyruvate hydrolase
VRLVTVRVGGGAEGTRAGRIEGDQVVLLPHADVGALLVHDDWERRAAADEGEWLPLTGASLAPVVPRPPKIICLGLNYASHIDEMGHARPRYPTLFAKYARALIGARDPIVLPRVSEAVDWEVELAFVIGRAARHVSPASALGHIAGWTVFNDVSVRDYQRRTQEFLSGKTFEATNPVGPALVTRDEVAEGGLGLRVQCIVDGQVMQDSNTSDLLFPPAEIVSYVSDIVTLEPGDLIATGTPAGVAAGRTPPPWLRAGQVVTTLVEGVGELENRCIAEL